MNTNYSQSLNKSHVYSSPTPGIDSASYPVPSTLSGSNLPFVNPQRQHLVYGGNPLPDSREDESLLATSGTGFPRPMKRKAFQSNSTNYPEDVSINFRNGDREERGGRDLRRSGGRRSRSGSRSRVGEGGGGGSGSGSGSGVGEGFNSLSPTTYSHPPFLEKPSQSLGLSRKDGQDFVPLNSIRSKLIRGNFSGILN